MKILLYLWYILFFLMLAIGFVSYKVGLVEMLIKKKGQKEIKTENYSQYKAKYDSLQRVADSLRLSNNHFKSMNKMMEYDQQSYSNIKKRIEKYK